MSDSLVNSIQNVFSRKEPKNKSKQTSQRSFYEDEWDDYIDRRYNGYGGMSYVPPVSTTKPIGYHGNTKNTTYKAKKILVLHPNGAEDSYTVPYDCEGWFNIARSVWPTTDEVMRVPVEHCKFTYREPAFNACVYTATNDYMQARWGRRLDDSDRRWLASHPLSTNNGVPQEYTATCIDQLVEPYGMRISRVRLRRGSLVLGDSIMAWIQSLGCNPLALADRSTSNEQAATMLGMPLDQANALWRVEFHDNPLPCSIIGERGWSNGNGVATGAMGGHARYLAPRGSAGDWFISVQLDMDSNVSHLVPPPNPEYVPRQGDPTLLIGSVTGPDGKLIAEKSGTTWKSLLPTTEPVTLIIDEPEQPQLGLVDTRPVPVKSPSAYYCLHCGDEKALVEMLLDGDICYDCCEEVWSGGECPHCQQAFDRLTPEPLAFDQDHYYWQCQSCRGEISVPEDTSDPYLAQIAELSFAYFANRITEPDARLAADWQ